MLVRVDGVAVSDDAMAKARSDVKLLSRLKHDHVLRMDFVSAVAGRVGQVYEHSGGAALSQVQAAELTGGRPIPLRVCVEIAAAVALALEEAGRLVQGPSRIDHPGPEPQDILIERTGRPRLSGFVVATGALARRRGFSPPEEKGNGGGPAVMTWMTTQFLSELIRASGRQGEVSPPLATAMRVGFSNDPASRPGPGPYARTLREVAGAMSGPGLRAWAEVPVREVLAAARSAESQPARNAAADTVRIASSPSLPPASFTDVRPVREIRPSPTIIPDFETEEPPRIASSRTMIPDFEPEFETEEPAVDRPLAEARPQALPVSVGPNVGPAPARSDIRIQAPAATRPVAASLPPPGLAFAPTVLTTAEPPAQNEPRPPVGRQGPAMGLAGGSAQGGGPSPASARPSLGPAFGGGPSLMQGPAPGGPALGGPALGPRRVDPVRGADGPGVDIALDGTSEPDEPPPSRTGLYIGIAAVGLLSILVVLVAAAAAYLYRPSSSGVIEAPLGVEALPEPATPATDAAGTLAAPSAPAPTVVAPAPASSASTGAATPPAATPPAATPPAASSSTAAPAAATPARSTTTTSSARSTTAAPADDEPERISSGDARVTTATTTATTTASTSATTATTAQPAAPAAPEEPGPFDLSFRPAEGDITSLEVRCAGQSGAGMVVELNQVPKATSCKITGLGGAAPLQTLVTVTSARSYTCFSNGSRSCR
jgi:hypothetical protein